MSSQMPHGSSWPNMKVFHHFQMTDLLKIFFFHHWLLLCSGFCTSSHSLLITVKAYFYVDVFVMKDCHMILSLNLQMSKSSFSALIQFILQSAYCTIMPLEVLHLKWTWTQKVKTCYFIQQRTAKAVKALLWGWKGVPSCTASRVSTSSL